MLKESGDTLVVALVVGGVVGCVVVVVVVIVVVCCVVVVVVGCVVAVVGCVVAVVVCCFTGPFPGGPCAYWSLCERPSKASHRPTSQVKRWSEYSVRML